ncbi:sugar kinase [Lentibacillus sp. N15]|uniref:sugar kinase n=1 Tax=Lentibacillus songyuanensis TaxID=3136161 RepID=UPI0031BAEB0C
MLKNDVITIGDAMITFNPASKGPMRYVHSFEKKVGGAELNFAIGCARLGLKIGIISRTGNDEFGRHILNFIRGEGIDISEVKLMDEYPTSINFKEILEDGSGRTFYYRHPSPTNELTLDSISEEFIRNSKVLHITGVFAAINPKNIAILEHAAKLAKKNNVKVSFDPNIRLKLWSLEDAREGLLKLLPYVDFVFSGEQEAEWLFGPKTLEQYIDTYKEYGAEHVIIKRGDEGSVGYFNGEIINARAKKPRKVVDTVGAGDGFNAGYIYSYLQGSSLKESLEFANTVGSMVVSVSGDNEGLPYLEDVLIATGKSVFIER